MSEKRKQILRKISSIYMMALLLFSSLAMTSLFTDIVVAPPTTPTVSTNATTGIEEYNATLHGYLYTNGSVDTTVGFRIRNSYSANYSFNITNGILGNGTSFYNNTDDNFIYESSTGSPAGTKGVSLNSWASQTFTVGATGLNESFYITHLSISGLSVHPLTKDTEKAVFGIRNVDENHFPIGDDLAFGYVYANALPSLITMKKTCLLEKGKEYAIVLRTARTVGDIGGGYGFSFVGCNNSYTGGFFSTSSNGGNTWGNFDEYYDIIFSVYGSKIAFENGNLYHYQAWANNTQGFVNGSEKVFLTKPLEPEAIGVKENSSFIASSYNDTVINLTWIKGEGANNTYIEYNTTTDWDIGDGIVIYNDTGTSYNHIGLSPNTKYYYQAWSYTEWGSLNQFSNNYSREEALSLDFPVVSSNGTYGVEEKNATLYGYLNFDGNTETTCGVRFWNTTNPSEKFNFTSGIVANASNFFYDVGGVQQYEYHSSSSTTGGFFGKYWYSQTFTVGTVGANESFFVDYVKINLQRDTPNPSNNVTMYIKNVDGSGLPIGSPLSTGIGLGSLIPVFPSFAGIVFEMNPKIFVSAGQQYALVYGAPNNSMSQRINYRFNSDDTSYLGGGKRSSSNYGVTWGGEYGDAIFSIYGYSHALYAGKLYSFQAWADNFVGFSFGNNLTFMTKPYEPDTFTAIAYNGTQINLSWDIGEGANNTYIEYSTTKESWQRGTESLLYNGSGTSYEHTGLPNGQTVHYQAWSYTTWGEYQHYSDENSSDDSRTYTKPIITINETTGIEEQNATAHAYLLDTGDSISTCGFRIGTSSGSYGLYNITVGNYSSSTVFSYNLSSLVSGQIYYAQAWSKNLFYFNVSGETSFLTKPYTTTNATATAINDTAIGLSWDKGIGANNTYIEYNLTSDTWGRGQGVLIYNSTGTSYEHTGLSPFTTYYYQLWGYAEWEALHQFSDDNVSDSDTTKLYPEVPVGFTATEQGRDAIGLSWTKGANASKTVIRYKENGLPMDLTDGLFLYNGTGIATTANGLNINTTYGFRAWSWNDTVSTYSLSNVTDSATTLDDIPPVISSPSPPDSDTYVHLNIGVVQATISDAEGDLMDWAISTIPDVGTSSGFGSGNSTIGCSISTLSVSTLYTWHVNVYDWYKWTNETYTFTTTSGNIILVTNDATSVEESSATLHGTLTDDSGETCDVWFEYGTSPTFGSKTSNQSKESGDSFQALLSSLQVGSKIYYRAVADNPSEPRAYGSTKSFLLKPEDSPSSFSANTYSSSRMDLSWSKASGADNTLIVRKQNSYPTSRTDGTIVYNSTGTSYSDTGLSSAGKWYYRAWSVSIGSVQFSDNYSQAWNYTLPTNPTDVSIYLEGISNNLNISWTKATDGDVTVIRYSTSDYPSSPTEGVSVYNGTGEHVINYNVTEPRYYTLWTGKNFSGTWVFSSGVDAGFGAIFINCYDELYFTNVTFNVFITNQDGSETFVQYNNTNTLIIQTSDIPTGEKVAFSFSAFGYYPRYFYMDIEEDTWYDITAILPPINYSELYLITVINQYDFPIEDVLIKTRVAHPVTGQYITFSQLYTDANGQVNLYLVGGTVYKWELIKAGYKTSYPDYIPDPNLNTHTFRMEYTEVSPEVREGLFDNIVWSIEPEQRYHSNGFTLYYNITSLDSQLENFRMVVWLFNESTWSWTHLYNETKYSSSGGSISYTIANNTGEYHIACYFDKYNFSEVEVTQEGSRVYFISWGGLYTNPTFGAIPDWIYVLIMVIVMIVVMAYLLPYVGLPTGYIGIGIFGFFLSLKPDLVFSVGPNDVISGWFVLILTAFVYTIALFLWSRY